VKRGRVSVQERDKEVEFDNFEEVSGGQKTCKRRATWARGRGGSEGLSGKLLGIGVLSKAVKSTQRSLMCEHLGARGRYGGCVSSRNPWSGVQGG